MKPEKLKVIAKKMGYEYVRINLDKDVQGYPKNGFHRIIYNPLANNDQMVEIIDKLVLQAFSGINITFTNRYRVIDKNLCVLGEGKTINEAVCNAAYVYFSGTK